MRKCLLVSTLLLITSAAHAGITIGGTRVVYPENKKESSIAITNPDNTDYLVQSRVETEGKVRSAVSDYAAALPPGCETE